MEEKLYDPSKMENVCDKHATGTLQDIFDAIFIDENHTLSEKRRKPQKSRVAAVLHSLSLFRNQVVYYK